MLWKVLCGLVKSVLYVHVIMLMSVQLHDCPLWPSVVLPAIDQGRVSRARSGTSLWWIYQLLVQARSGFPGDRGDSSLLRCAASCGSVHTGSFQETRSGQSVNTQTPYLEAIKLRDGAQKVNLFTFIANYYTTLTFQWNYHWPLVSGL